MDVTLEMSALAFLEQAEVKELVRPSQQSWLDSSRPTLITCSRVRPEAVGQLSVCSRTLLQLVAKSLALRILHSKIELCAIECGWPAHRIRSITA